MVLVSTNPSLNEPISTYTEHTPAECDRIVREAATAFSEWKCRPPEHRSDCLRHLAGLLRTHRDTIAALITAEMGKRLVEAVAEVDKSADACTFFAEHGPEMLTDEPVATEARKSGICYEPLGVILGIMPWNFPVWQVIRYAVPALLAGNTTVLKHANNATGCALALERLFREAGFPENALRVLVIDVPFVKQVIGHPLIAGVTLTGSPRAGRAVAAAAGAALKKTVLELGGSDPFLILHDADLNAAAEMIVASRLLVTGQVCISPKRVIVPAARSQELIGHLEERIRRTRMGDPLDSSTTYGPMARTDLRDAVHRQVEQCRQQGARVNVGGSIPPEPGAWYPATLLTDIRAGMPAWEEEIFGPVVAVIDAADEDDAVRIANSSPYGLGAVVFSDDPEQAEQVARRIRAGCCFVNTPVRSDPRLPFGGVGLSGYGRELGAQGLREFTNVKTIYVA